MITLSDRFYSEIIYSTKHNRMIDAIDIKKAMYKLFEMIYPCQVRRGPQWKTKRDKKWILYFRFINNKNKDAGCVWETTDQDDNQCFVVEVNFHTLFSRREQLKILYHELTHVKQEVTGQFVRWEKQGFPYDGDLRKSAYWNHPSEKEAKLNECYAYTHYRDRKRKSRKELESVIDFS